MIAALAVAALLGAAPAPPPDAAASVYLRPGTPAPWAGWLVDEQRLTLAMLAESDLQTCRDDLGSEKKDRAADARQCADDLAGCNDQVAECLEAGRECVAPPVDPWPIVGAAGGGLAAGVVVTLIVLWARGDL